MQSADARLQATGMFQTTAIRKRAFISVSWAASRADPEEVQEIDFPVSDLGPDLLVATSWPTLELDDFDAQFLLQLRAGCSRRYDHMLHQAGSIPFRPLQQILLLVVVCDEGDPLLRLQAVFRVLFHSAPCLFLQQCR